MFMILYFVLGYVCAVSSASVLVADTDFSSLVKGIIYAMLLYAWFSPIFVWKMQAKNLLSPKGNTIFANISYFMFGFAFLLSAVLIFVLLGLSLLFNTILGSVLFFFFDAGKIFDMSASIILSLTLFLSLCAVYQAKQMPKLLQYSFSDLRIKKSLKVLLISDLHITKMTPVEKVKKWVSYFNSFKADIILLTGDIGDDKTSDIKKQISELKKLESVDGIYYVVGNHEVYFNPMAWESEFASLGWQILHNSGVEVQNTGLYIAGVPDASAMSANPKQALKNSHPEQFRILLSHAPSVVCHLEKGEVDLQLSGHTHGGQLFPFNFLTRLGNKGLLAGKYNIKGTNLIISRGVGYWGPPMRLFAPSDVVLINLDGKL